MLRWNSTSGVLNVHNSSGHWCAKKRACARESAALQCLAGFLCRCAHHNVRTGSKRYLMVHFEALPKAYMLVQKWALGVESSRSCGRSPPEPRASLPAPARAQQRRSDPRHHFKAAAGGERRSQALHSRSGSVLLVAVARVVLQQLGNVEATSSSTLQPTRKCWCARPCASTNASYGVGTTDVLSVQLRSTSSGSSAVCAPPAAA